MAAPYFERRLDIIVGPMFSGKSLKLMEVLRRAVAGPGRTVLLINSSLDTRCGDDSWSTHATTDAVAISENVPTRKVRLLKQALALEEYRQAHLIGIDEAQFFDDLVDFCTLALQHNKSVVVAGLDGDYRRQRFGHVLDLAPMANTLTKLTALCSCGREAPFTLRKSAENKQLCIGDKNIYTSVCRDCYEHNG